MRAAIYTRVSQDREGREVSVSIQEEVCRALAARKGADVRAVFTDNDRGASTLSKKKRPAFESLMARTRAGEFDVILAYSSSRLTRRPREYETIIELAQATGVKVFTDRSGDPDFTTADGRAVARTIAAWDAAEAERTGERVRSNVEYRVSQGLDLGGQRPFGFNADRTTINEVEAEAVRGAYRAFLESGSIYAATVFMNSTGLKTVTGRDWGHSTVRKMLKRSRNRGVLEHNGSVVADDRPQIVDDMTFLRAQALMSTFTPITAGGNKPKTLLSGIALCGRCGRPMVNGGKVYRCEPVAGQFGTNSAERSRRDREAVHSSMTKTLLDDVVCERTFLRMVEMSLAGDGRGDEDRAESGEIAVLRGRIADAKQRRDQAQEMGFMPGANMALVRERLAEFEKEVGGLEAELEQALAASTRETIRHLARESLREVAPGVGVYRLDGEAAYREWLPRFNALALDRRQAIIRSLWKRIEVRANGRGRGRVEFEPWISAARSPAATSTM